MMTAAPDGTPVNRYRPLASVSTGPCAHIYEKPELPRSTHADTFAPSMGRPPCAKPSEITPEIVSGPEVLGSCGIGPGALGVGGTEVDDGPPQALRQSASARHAWRQRGG